MEIKINLVEVATKLAHNRLLEDLMMPEEESLNQIYEEDEDSESSTYREGFQELFDEFYDEYYNEILMLKKGEEPNREGWSESLEKYSQEVDDELLLKDI